MHYVLKNGVVFDGLGNPPKSADVVVRDGRIVDVVGSGEVSAEAGGADVIDLDGRVLAPGFIDVHTHFDAQITWDPTLTPSCWHGVTTTVMGNCGFGIAPTRAENRRSIMRTLENVEGMPYDALEAGINWAFETFPEYLDAIDDQPKLLNVAVMIGHTPVRLYVLGDGATERTATADEIERMREIIREAIRAGAIGFATSRAAVHVGEEGKPVPSRLADHEEIQALTSVLGEEDQGLVQVTRGPGLDVEELAEIARDTGRPVTWTALLTSSNPRGWAAQLLDRAEPLGGEVWPQIACHPIVQQVTLEDPGPLANAPAFAEVFAADRERRAEIYSDPAWIERAKADIERVRSDTATLWDRISVDETAVHPELTGLSLAEIALTRGTHPFDLMVQLSLQENLQTRFRMMLTNYDDEEIAELLRDRRTIVALSDAGAHVSQLCDASFATRLLSLWVRERHTLPLEEAIWRLTGQPAQVFRLQDRGVIRPGAWADLVSFDPDLVAPTPNQRVSDLPGGADRLINTSIGISDVWVNGVPICRNGEFDEKVAPGQLLRNGCSN